MDIVNKNQLQWEYYLRLKHKFAHETEREKLGFFYVFLIFPLFP